MYTYICSYSKHSGSLLCFYTPVSRCYSTVPSSVCQSTVRLNLLPQSEALQLHRRALGDVDDFGEANLDLGFVLAHRSW